MSVVRLPTAFKPANPLVSERELTRRRIARALNGRKRYRYVKPSVTTTEEGWLITSPCCSRNVDPEGGVIDIARLERTESGWTLLARDSSRASWLVLATDTRLEGLLQILCEDEERVFWP